MKINRENIKTFVNRFMNITIVTTTLVAGFGLGYYFQELKVEGTVLTIDSDEENKTWENANKILEFFETEGLLRREPVIAIGGGVLLDIVGY